MIIFPDYPSLLEWSPRSSAFIRLSHCCPRISRFVSMVMVLFSIVAVNWYCTGIDHAQGLLLILQILSDMEWCSPTKSYLSFIRPLSATPFNYWKFRWWADIFPRLPLPLIVTLLLHISKIGSKRARRYIIFQIYRYHRDRNWSIGLSVATI